MSTAVSPFPQAGLDQHDGLDDLFADMIGNDTNNHNGQYSSRDVNDQHDNNIDEEIQVKKKRKPVAKLDEARLLSAAGIPKLRRISKDKLRFNGKGNEFTDMARLLNTYQLWLDDLFPKAKFLDGLAMVEKLGHKKRIQLYRKEWIDEGKPKSAEDELDDFLAVREASSRSEGLADQSPRDEVADQGGSNSTHFDKDMPDIPAETRPHAEPPRQPNEDHAPDEDELDALLQAEPVRPQHTAPIESEIRQRGGQEPEEDELDALLNETGDTNGTRSLFGGPQPSNLNKQPTDDFADEEEAMAGMEW